MLVLDFSSFSGLAGDKYNLSFLKILDK